MAAGAVNIKLGAIVTDFVKSFQGATAAVGQFTSGLNTKLATAYAQADRQNRTFAKGFGRMASDLQAAGKSLSLGVTAPALLGGASAFKSYADIEGNIRGLTALSGSIEIAKAQFKEFKELAKLPGLGLEEAQAAGLRMEALGYSTAKATDYLTQFGNAVALGGKGKTEFDQILNQVTQMGSKSKVLAEDLKPIVNASPVIAKAIREMFGSVDSEQISAKLQAAGKGPADFLDMLVQKLSTVERVSGGPKNALENLADAGKIASFEFGQAADNALGLTEKIDGLGNTLVSAAEGFGKLSTGMQGTILTIGGVAAAIGPLALGLGTLVKIGPTVAKGFGAIKTAAAAIATPIGLAAAALAFLASGAYSLYSFNKAIESTHDKAKLLAQVNDKVTESVTAETTKLQAYLSVANNEKLSKETRINAIKELNALSPQYLGNLSLETLHTKETAAAINDYVKAITLKAKAQALENNLIKAEERKSELIKKGLQDQVGLLDQFGAAIQSGSIVGGLVGTNQAANLAMKGLERQTVAIMDAAKDADFYSKALQEVQKEMAALNVTAPKVKIADFTNVSGTAAKKGKKPDTWAEGMRKNLTAVEGLIKEFQAKYPNGEVPLFLKLQKGYYQDNLGIQDQDFKAFKGLTDNLNEIKSTTKRELAALGTDLLPIAQESWGKYFEVGINGARKMAVPLEMLLRTAEEGIQKVADLKRATGEYNNVDAGQDARAGVAGIRNTLDRAEYAGGLAGMLSGMVDPDLLQKAYEAGDIGVETINNIGQKLQNAMNLLSTGLQDTAGEAFSGFFDAIGSALGGDNKGFQNFGKTVLNLIAGLAQQIGKALILLYTPMLLSGLLSPIAIKGLAIGGAILAAGSLIKAVGNKDQAPGFAKGGIFSGENTIRVGEYSSASFNPEVVSPLRDLQGMLQPMVRGSVLSAFNSGFQAPQVSPYSSFPSGGRTVDVRLSGEARVSGSDIHLSIKRYEKFLNEVG
ncbi:hypothetical protein GCM10027299_28970 [Larkinella ripae]